MQLLRVSFMRLAWALALAVATFTTSSWSFALAPASKRVSFAEHGSDWKQGKCASRNKQSPIDLNEVFRPPEKEFHYNYKDLPFGDVLITNDGLTMAATLLNLDMSHVGGIFLEMGEGPVAYRLSSIDIKAESEHTLRGKHFPLEIQLVHKPAEFFAHSEGPAAVTVSIFVNCMNPPVAKQVWPGLLQEKAIPRKLRGNAALLQTSRQKQDPDMSDAVMPAGPPPLDPEEEDALSDPAQQRMDTEVNFVRNLAEGEDALETQPMSALIGPGGGPPWNKPTGKAPAPAGAPAPAEEPYVTPSPIEPQFNPLLQFLVQAEPPDLDTTSNTSIGGGTPFNLNALLGGGTYFNYWGSGTLPPCDENELWLVKREVVSASTAQVTALHEKLYLLSSGAGNYRTSMPLNERPVGVFTGKQGIPRLMMPTQPPHEEVSGKEQKYIDMAKDAITIAKAASDYAKDLDWRVQAGSTAHLAAMEAPEPTTQAPTTSAYIPKPPEDQIWATKIMSNIVKEGIKEAMKDNIAEMIPATASLATSYLRQRLLKKAGFGPPPVGAKVLNAQPMPGMPTFFPPIQYEQPSKQNMLKLGKMMKASNCTAAANFSGCGNITGLTPEEAKAIAQHIAATTDDAPAQDEENQQTPEDIQALLPAGALACPADWPDEDAWPNGLPPSGIPPYTSDWPDPSGTRPAGMSDYEWQRYQWNWSMYTSRYTPYVSSYSSYSISRRRRMSSYSSSRRRSYSSSSSSSYSSSRRRSYSSSSSSYSSSSRRRSYSSSSRRRSYR